MNMLRRFFRDERGLELSEYAVMAGMIIIVAILVILAIGNRITAIFQALKTQLDGVKTTPT